MDKIYQTLINKFILLKDKISFNGSDIISYNDENDKSFFLIMFQNFQYIIQFQAIIGLKTISDTHTYNHLNSELVEKLFSEFLDNKKKLKKSSLSDKMNIMFLKSECEDVIEDLEMNHFINDISKKQFDAYLYYSFLYLDVLDISLTCLYTIGTLKIKIYNRKKMKNTISILNLTDNTIILKNEFNTIINKCI